jgi:hypothetical protein
VRRYGEGCRTASKAGRRGRRENVDLGAVRRVSEREERGGAWGRVSVGGLSGAFRVSGTPLIRLKCIYNF